MPILRKIQRKSRVFYELKEGYDSPVSTERNYKSKEIGQTACELVGKKPDKEIRLGELVKILEKSYGYKKGTIYKSIDEHPQLRKRPGEGNTICVYIESNEPKHEDKDLESIAEIKTLIQSGESNEVEFKSSVRWDYRQNILNKKLEHEIAKTICSFGNTNGGRLLIGVDDKGAVLGLEKDYKTLGKKGNKDGFILQITNLIKNYLGKEYLDITHAEIFEIGQEDICLITVKKGKKPVYVKNQDRIEFYIRALASSEALNTKEAVDYITASWS